MAVKMYALRITEKTWDTLMGDERISSYVKRDLEHRKEVFLNADSGVQMAIIRESGRPYFGFFIMSARNFGEWHEFVNPIADDWDETTATFEEVKEKT